MFVNADKTIVFVAAGGGSFEFPEMFDLFHAGRRIRLECGGAGRQPMCFAGLDTPERALTIQVTRLEPPPGPGAERDAVLALMAEAFAVQFMHPLASSLPVRCRMLDAAGLGTPPG